MREETWERKKVGGEVGKGREGEIREDTQEVFP